MRYQELDQLRNRTVEVLGTVGAEGRMRKEFLPGRHRVSVWDKCLDMTRIMAAKHCEFA